MPEFFYYANQSQVPLEVVNDTVAVAFNEPISARRMADLRASDRTLDVLGRSPALLARNVLVYRKQSGERSPERIQDFAMRLSQGNSVQYTTLVFRDPESNLYLVMIDEIVVKFKEGVSQAQIGALNAEQHVDIIQQKLYDKSQFVLRVLNPTPDRTLTVANAYAENLLVEWASPNFLREKRLGNLRDKQWHLHNVGQTLPGLPSGVIGEDAKVHEAWAITRGSGNVVIAILDTGVDTIKPGLAGDTGHPSLQINIAEGGRSFEPNEAQNDPTPDNPELSGVEAHGTACAGVAAGSGGRIDGVAPRCKILPIKMIQAFDNDIADAFVYSAQRAQILSNSWSLGPSDPIQAAIRQVTTTGREGKGTVVCFLTQNSNQRAPRGPQTAPNVISVGASTNVGSRAGYSNFGDANDTPPNKRINLVAPSAGVDSLRANGFNVNGSPDGSTENIYTTDIRGRRGFNPPKQNGNPAVLDPTVRDPVADPDYTGMFSGTSSATPLVAGICGLMLSVNAALTRAQVQYVLEATADKIGTGVHRVDVPDGRVLPGQDAHYNAEGYDLNPTTRLSGYGFGRVNAEKAVKAARGDALPQLVRPATGAPALANAIPVVLTRVPGTNHFVSAQTIELVDARRDPQALNAPDRIFVRGGPGGFLRATFQPAGGGPSMSDEVDIQGTPA